MDSPSPTDRKRDLPARLEPILLTTEAASLLFSVTYDAHRLGSAMGSSAREEIGDNYHALNQSRAKLVRYISRLEKRLGLDQHSFHKFD
jgi:hypothetical protein